MLKLKIPPVVVTLFFGGLIWLTDYFIPNESLFFAYRKWVSALLLLLGVVIALWGVIEFRRKSTTVNPHKPQKTNNLVDTGIYQLSRNPMYLGLFLVLCSWIFWLGNVYSLIVLPLFVWYMNSYQIYPEEEVLREKFGSSYVQYQKKVRRWI